MIHLHLVCCLICLMVNVGKDTIHGSSDDLIHVITYTPRITIGPEGILCFFPIWEFFWCCKGMIRNPVQSPPWELDIWTINRSALPLKLSPWCISGIQLLLRHQQWIPGNFWFKGVNKNKGNFELPQALQPCSLQTSRPPNDPEEFWANLICRKMQRTKLKLMKWFWGW